MPVQNITLRPITAADTHALRLRVLRDNDPAANLHFPGDDAPDSIHWGAFAAGALIGIATLHRRALAGQPDAVGWQLRGMAVAPDYQAHGIGGRLLAACCAHVQAQGGGVLWCHARVAARRFYEAHGLRVEGTPFNLPIGPHYLMWRALPAAGD